MRRSTGLTKDSTGRIGVVCCDSSCHRSLEWSNLLIILSQRTNHDSHCGRIAKRAVRNWSTDFVSKYIHTRKSGIRIIRKSAIRIEGDDTICRIRQFCKLGTRRICIISGYITAYICIIRSNITVIFSYRALRICLVVSIICQIRISSTRRRCDSSHIDQITGEIGRDTCCNGIDNFVSSTYRYRHTLIHDIPGST